MTFLYVHLVEVLSIGFNKKKLQALRKEQQSTKIKDVCDGGGVEEEAAVSTATVTVT